MTTTFHNTSTLSVQDVAAVKSELEELQAPVVVKVIQNGSPLSEQFRQFIDHMASANKKVKPLYVTYPEDTAPAIEVKPNLRYLAIPSGRELSPFLQTLILCSQGKTSLSSRSLEALQTFITPTHLEVIITSDCPHCPTVVSLANRLALQNNYVEVSIIDVTLFDAYGARYGIRAVPTVVIDGEHHVVGEVSEDTLVDRLVNRSPSAFHPDTFKKIVKEGDAKKLAGMMVAEDEIYPGALELLADPDWSVRMGIMVVLEEVARTGSALVRQAYPLLLELLRREEANLRGDAAYLLGRIGDTSVLGRLQELTSDPHPEVTEAVVEAVALIQKRYEIQA